MKSFFRKVTTDSVPLKKNNKRFNFKTGQDLEDGHHHGAPGNGNNFWIENCPNFHLGNTYYSSTTNILTNDAVHISRDKNVDSPKDIPKNVKDHYSDISEATIEHFELISSKIINLKNLGEELCFPEDNLHYFLKEGKGEFIVCRMLHKWKKAKTREATVGLLLKVLWDAKEYEAAIFLSENL